MQVLSLSDLVDVKAVEGLMAQLVRKIWRDYETAETSLQSLLVSSITPLSRFAVSSRLQRARDMLSSLEESGVKPYEPFIIESPEYVRLICPPLIEAWGNRHFLIDGTHRILASQYSRVTDIIVIVVKSSIFSPLPCDAVEWDAVEISEEQKPIEQVLQPLKRSFIRPATMFFNSSEFLYKNVQELVEFCNDLTEKPR